MTHDAEITGSEKKENVVKIYYKVTVDGDEIEYPELDGEVIKDSFDLSYNQYRDNERVKRHLKRWRDIKIQKLVEEHDPSESVEGLQV